MPTRLPARISRSRSPPRSLPRKRRARAAVVTPPEPEAPTDRERIWQALAAVPRGRVSTYGEIAALAGLPGRARLVGRALAHLPAASRLPWHRIVNAAGRISVRGGGELVQASRLRREGVRFAGTRIDLERFGWPDDDNR